MKAKRIFAILGVVLLLSLYISTLIFALMDSPASSDLLKASILATVGVPILIYAFQLIYRIRNNKK